MNERLIVGYDTEYISNPTEYIPISSQLYVLNDNKPYFIDHVGKHLKFSDIAEFIKERYPKYKNITLITHFGRSELMPLKDGLDIVLTNNFKAIQKTFIGNIKYEDMSFEFVDTYLLTNTSLESLGEWLGIGKIESHGYREEGKMLEWYQSNPEEFKAYALRDAEITAKFYVRFMDTLKEHNLIGNREPKTIGSIGEQALFRTLLKGNYGNLGYKKERIIDSNGKIRGHKLTTPNHIKLFETSYYGGRNETYLYGIHEGRVYDYDLKNAYGNILSNIPEWEFKKPKYTKNHRKLYRFLKKYPLSLGYVDIDFEFKDDVKYPSLPIKYDGGVYFPLSGSTVCTLQEFLVSYPHLKRCSLLAKVYKPISPSCISEFINNLKTKRNKAKQDGNKFLSNTLKLITNSGYGKFLQGFNKNKKSVDLKNSTRQKVVTTPIPESRISNYAIGSFITGCVRAQVAEYLHYFNKENIKVGNCTTDGFAVFRKLTDKELSHVGVFTEYMMNISGDSLLEEKHSGKGYLAIKTRGYSILIGENILFSATGISLRNKTTEKKRDSLLEEFLKLTPFKDTKYIQQTLPSIREWILTGTITPKEEYRSYNFDYDLKRIPTNPRMTNTISFETRPYESIEEAMFYRESYKNFHYGDRDESGKHTHAKNKLITLDLIAEFEEYMRIRKANFDTIHRINNKTPLKIFVNLLKRFKPELGYKKIHKLTSIPHTTVRHWIKDYPMSEKDLKKGANSLLLQPLRGLLAPQLVDLVIAEFEAWINPQDNTVREYLSNIRHLINPDIRSMMLKRDVGVSNVSNKGDP